MIESSRRQEQVRGERLEVRETTKRPTAGEQGANHWALLRAGGTKKAHRIDARVEGASHWPTPSTLTSHLSPLTLLRRLVVTSLVILALTAAAGGERIKDIVSIKGVRSNPLTGFGLVVGLNGTGDGSNLSTQALNNFLRRQNIRPETLGDLSSKNIASVVVTAQLGPWDRTGSQIDVIVSAVGNAKSLQGGTLLATELKGLDGQVHAVAQGAITLGGGFSASGKSSSVTKNHVTVGTIAGGGHVEKEELATYVEEGEITLQLRNPDFATANEIAKIINTTFASSAHAPDAGAVRFVVPKGTAKTAIAGVIQKVGTLEVTVDMPALVVINERTGTIIVGANVGISTVAISHGNLSMIIQEKENVSQPQPFSNTGSTAKTNETRIDVAEDASTGGQTLHVVPRQVSVAELARAINAMGLSPRDLISIFEALKQAGALQAQLKIF